LKDHSKTPESNPTGTVFNEYARYYDLLYRDKDYEAEADYIAGLIRRFCPTGRSILELGSGTGKHARLLFDRGFRVHGIERSPEMLARSLNAAASVPQTSPLPDLSFSLGDIRTARLPGKFDAAISLFHVLSYQTANNDVKAAFETARRHLNPGGIFIFDVWYGPAVLTQRPEVRIKRMADDQSEITRLAEPVIHPNENRVDVHYYVFVRNPATRAVSELKETHAMRYFFKPEIELWAASSGFAIAYFEEWLSANPIGADTWSACFCLRALPDISP
jgi:SAM-dependent methyltransferase